MKISFRPILGSLRLLGRRSVEVDRPGLALWAGEGEKAATDVRAFVRDQSHAAECDDAEAARLLEEAMRDGKLDNSDRPLVAKALRHVKRSAERDHDLGETAS